MTDKSAQTGEEKGGRPLRNAPTGGLPVTDERWPIVEPHWRGNFTTLRLMDELTLGETEPATLFVWGTVQDERD